ncbi:hypothetical protein EDB81DRAFT_661019 [Dactylonectria macrodidyma]|uniref:Peptidase S8/S53 domain-containing protein n=1 Tax=Dactylonectria macrodidyma TaxID=307937 RepID=A0A9P9E4L3_9HYPO|nr:hypothetical protein EDB81DRAFT_661019 [Dactylonectria macrodidyma]
MLASWAKHFSRLAQEVVSEPRSSLTQDLSDLVEEIIKSLNRICRCVDSLPRYWISPEVEIRSRHLFEKLAQICLVCNKPELVNFSRECLQLLEALKPIEDGQNNGLALDLKGLSHTDPVKHSQALFKFLEQHCRCNPLLHSEPEHCNAKWHAARLGLERGRSCTKFDILLNTITGTTTPQQGLFCSFMDKEMLSCATFSFDLDGGLVQSTHPGVQKLIPAVGDGEPLSGILRDYRLTHQDRILLAYTVAKAYWQFYDSDLMRVKWSSNSIWFMPTPNSDELNQLPLRVFVTLPFGIHTEPLENEVHDGCLPLTHCFPRIFALGIILLEIGLANPFPTKTFIHPITQANHDCNKAISLLNDLRKARWVDVPQKNYFIDAVEYCLKDERLSNFTIPQLDPARPASFQPRQDIASTKVYVHNRVVLPLAYLAERCFQGISTEMTYVTKKRESNVTHKNPGPAIVSGLRYGALLSGELTSRKEWLSGLKSISKKLDGLIKAHNIETRVRVAILDTGVGLSKSFYEEIVDGKMRQKKIINWEDYVSPRNESPPPDLFGHGTLMARLIMEVCPFADIIVVRVAKTTNDLSNSQERIAKGIKWAGEQGANIISMSFGLSRPDHEIAKAMHGASNKDKGVIFFASAGNSPDEPEYFPARDPSVISIYATNTDGTFAKSNSRRPTDGSAIFSTFGDAIDPKIQNDFDKEFPNVCRPGSSIATAVAAGIGATMLTYASILSQRFGGPPHSEARRVLRRMQSSQGMAAIFRAMAEEKHHGRFFVNPSQFWKNRKSDEARYHEISARLWEADRQLPLPETPSRPPQSQPQRTTMP